MMMRLLILTLSLLLPYTSWAEISYVGVTNSAADTVSAGSITTSVTVSAGTDPSLTVLVQARGSAGGAAVSSVTRGAQSFTLAKAQTQVSGSTFRSEAWVLPNATVGTANVVVTWASAANNEAQGYSVIQADGVSLTSPIDATSGAGADSTATSSTITTVADGALIIDCAFARDNVSYTVGADQTQRVNRVLASATVVDVAAVSTTAKATHGEEVMSWTQSSAQAWAHVAVSLTPSGGSDPGSSAPVQANLAWTNGTDAVGVVSATPRRCTGANCIPSVALGPVIPASNGSAGTYVDTTVQLNTTYGYDIFNSDAAGNPSLAFSPIRYITTGTTFRNVLVSRDFSVLANGADIGSDFTAGYTAYDACALVSGTVRSINVNTACLESYNGVAPPNDQWVQASVPTLEGAVATNMDLWCRLANAPTITGYAARVAINSTAFTIYEVTADTYVALDTASTPAHANGDRYRFECEGTALRLYRIRGTVETLLVDAADGTISAGKTGVSLKVATAGTLPSLQINSYAMGGYSTTQDVAPTITGLTLDATGANLTYGSMTPTRIIVRLFNSQTSLDVEKPIADFPAGRFTQTWVAGWDGVCMIPVDSLGVANTSLSAYRCTLFGGIIQPIDTVPPVLSGCTPSGNLPEGTTSTIISCDIDKPAVCAFDTTDIPVLTMQTTDVMQTSGLKCSYNLTGLSAGVVTRYVGAYTINENDPSITYPDLTNQAITFTILAAPAADVTDPSTVANLTGTLSGLVATLQWGAATDNVAVAGYQVYQSTDACVTPFLAGSPVAATSTQVNLGYDTDYCWQVKAIDTSNRLSAAFSNAFSLTTGPFVDVIPPSTMAGLTTNCGFTASCVLTWDTGTDEHGPVTSSIEYCLVISPSTDCSNFSVFRSLISVTTLSTDLAAGSRYCFRGQHSDGVNVGGYSETVCGTTVTAGIGRPRPTLRFNVTRPQSSSSPTAPTRPTKP